MYFDIRFNIPQSTIQNQNLCLLTFAAQWHWHLSFILDFHPFVGHNGIKHSFLGEDSVERSQEKRRLMWFLKFLFAILPWFYLNIRVSKNFGENGSRNGRSIIPKKTLNISQRKYWFSICVKAAPRISCAVHIHISFSFMNTFSVSSEKYYYPLPNWLICSLLTSELQLYWM